MKRLSLLAALLLSISTSGCYATKLVSVPMRLVGAVASAVPVVGNTAHNVIDEAAEVVDDLP
jgi:hypothetical protein